MHRAGVVAPAAGGAVLVPMEQVDDEEVTVPAVQAAPSEAVAAVLAGAVEVARQAVIESSGDTVGDSMPGVTAHASSTISARMS